MNKPIDPTTETNDKFVPPTYTPTDGLYDGYDERLVDLDTYVDPMVDESFTSL